LKTKEEFMSDHDLLSIQQVQNEANEQPVALPSNMRNPTSHFALQTGCYGFRIKQTDNFQFKLGNNSRNCNELDLDTTLGAQDLNIKMVTDIISSTSFQGTYMIIAGGFPSCLASATPWNIDDADIDCFVCGGSSAYSAAFLIMDVINKLMHLHNVRVMEMFVSAKAVTVIIHVERPRYHPRHFVGFRRWKLQFVLRTFMCPLDVLTSFDIDQCKWALIDSTLYTPTEVSSLKCPK